MHHTKQKAFTLVELIVVITILAILWTIAFMSFNSYSSSARDSARISDLTNIAKGLWVQYATSGKYPLPDNYATISNSGTILGYQWYVWDTTKRIIRISEPSKDPLDAVFYTYNTNDARNKYQVLAFLENWWVTSFVPDMFRDDVFAKSYTARYPYEKWDNIWFVLSATWNLSSPSTTTYTPLQDTSTWVDISWTNTWMVVLMDTSSTATWWSTAFTSLATSYAATTSTGSVPDAYTVLLMHFDGSNWSTVFSDSSTTHKTANVFWNAQISTAKSEFWWSSLLLDWNWDYIEIPSSSDFNFWTSDFTVDTYVNITDTSWVNMILSNLSASNWWELEWEPAPYYLCFNVRSPDTWACVNWTPIANTWYHMAVVRQSWTVKIYVNWTQVWSSFSTPSIQNSTQNLTIWNRYEHWFWYELTWNIDELRISKWIARWTSNFTPPTSPY